MQALEQIRARAAKATPGPWSWFGNIGAGSPYLATTHSGRRYVMQFARHRMQGAQPVFQQPDEHIMVKGADLAVFEVAHRDDIVGFDNPDATFIAHARADVDTLLQLVDDLTGQVDELTQDRDRLADELADMRAERDGLAAELDRTGSVAGPAHV